MLDWNSKEKLVELFRVLELASLEKKCDTSIDLENEFLSEVIFEYCIGK